MPRNTIIDETFSAVDLTSAIIDLVLPERPLIENLIDVDEEGIDTTEGIVERDGEFVQLIPTAPRGGVSQPHRTANRDNVRVEAVHMSTRAAVLADQAQNIRAFGSSGRETPELLRNKYLLAMKKNLVHTMGNHLMGAVKGQVLDADGTVILDSFALWGVAQQTTNFALDVPSTNLTLKGVEVARKSEDALGGVRPTEYVGLASPTFMDLLRAHAYYEKRLQFAAPSSLMSDYRTGIVVGDITFIEVRSAPGWPIAIEDGVAYVVPRGVAGLFIRRFAPGDYNSSVNTIGLPFYAKSEPMSLDKGYICEAQSNPFTLCTRPRSIVKVTASA